MGLEPPVGIEPTTFSLRGDTPGCTRLHSSPLTCGNALGKRCYDGPGTASIATELHQALFDQGYPNASSAGHLMHSVPRPQLARGPPSGHLHRPGDRHVRDYQSAQEPAEEVDVRLQVLVTEEAVMHGLAPGSAESRTQLRVVEQRFQCAA